MMRVDVEDRGDSRARARPSSIAPRALDATIASALDHLESRQSERGCWEGDYGGPLFLLPMYVGVHHLVGKSIEEATAKEMVRYLFNHINEDGAFGLHIQGPSHVFTSTLNYIALRLLGVEADDERLSVLRAYIHAHGGPTHCASWGKFFLTLLNLYEYEGLDPVCPELWLLPKSLPVHPGKLWCHSRMVYLPMSYLYGRRVQGQLSPLIEALREELYPQGYGNIDWVLSRKEIAEVDDYVPITSAMRGVNSLLHLYERNTQVGLREKALAFVLEQIRAEDRNTSHICIGPVSKLFHTLVWFYVDPEGDDLKKHLAQLPDYLYEADDGIKMQGYNSSELWDTAFAVQAFEAAGEVARRFKSVEAAHAFIEQQQVLEDVPDREATFRDPSKGGWPFSDRAHGWPISDCTAEGLKAALCLQADMKAPIPFERLEQAVDLLLFWQNDDGGWATYEKTRAGAYLEALNPSNCFDRIMIDYSYIECTSAAMQALKAFSERYPANRRESIDKAMQEGLAFLLEAQGEDGSWEGSWGVCFTYGAFFGAAGLRAAGLGVEHPALKKTAAFLKKHQLPDGGLGEASESCRARTYVSTEKGQSVMSAWALMALLDAEGPSEEATCIARFLMGAQNPEGGWQDDVLSGMFNRTSGIHYDNYSVVFPPWALAKYRTISTPSTRRRPD